MDSLHYIFLGIILALIMIYALFPRTKYKSGKIKLKNRIRGNNNRQSNRAENRFFKRKNKDK